MERTQSSKLDLQMHTFSVARPGIEPGPHGCEPDTLTTMLSEAGIKVWCSHAVAAYLAHPLYGHDYPGLLFSTEDHMPSKPNLIILIELLQTLLQRSSD